MMNSYMKVIHKTDEMQQIHNLYYEQCFTCFGRYTPIVRSAGTVCAAFGVTIFFLFYVFSDFYYMWVCGYLGDVLQLLTQNTNLSMDDEISFPGIIF
jgi:hypothetical protein